RLVRYGPCYRSLRKLVCGSELPAGRMPRCYRLDIVLPSPVPTHRLEPESLPFAYWTDKRLFHSTPKAFGAEAASPLAAIFAHQVDDAIAHLEEPLLKHAMLGHGNELLGQQLSRRVHRYGDGFQGPLQISDGHSDFIDIFIAQCRGQFRAGQGGMGRQFNGGRFVLERTVFVEELVDPNRERERRAIQTVVLESFNQR